MNLTENIYDDNFWLDQNHLMEFLNSIEGFIEKKSNRISEIYREGLNVFLRIPDSIGAALYILEGEFLDFELKLCIPNEIDIQIKELFDSNIDNGNIGNALNSGLLQSHLFKNDLETNVSLLIVPLLSSNGCIGLVLIILNKTLQKEELLIKLCSVFSNIFANSLESNNILLDLANAKLLLEQKVSAKTMDLSQSKRELKAIFDSVLTAILVYDISDKKIIKVNPIALELLGAEESDIVGTEVDLYLDNFELDTSNGIQVGFIREPVESFLNNKMGKQISILRNLTYLFLGKQKLGIESFIDNTLRKNAELALKETNKILELKVLERTEDLHLLIHKLKNEISDREKAQLELRKMFEKEKELNELKSRFVNMVSHEFRTPLTVIRSSAQMIDKFKNNLSTKDMLFFVDKIMKTVDNMTDLIENVIFIGKSESKTLRISDQKVNIVEYCENIVKDIKLGFGPEREVFLSIVGNYSKIRLDEKLLRLILYNLLSNALKYSEKNQPVIFNVDIDEKNITFVVEDFGIGIPDSEQNKVFALFYRANNVGTITGTGLGLSVVYESVEKMDGKIEIFSKVGKGTKFTISLPICSDLI